MKFIYPFFLCFLAGCAVVPTSTKENPTLLAGECIFVGGDYVAGRGISFEKETTYGIEITLRNAVTNETIRLRSGKNGLFYTTLQEGKYLIKEFYLKKEARSDSTWAAISATPGVSGTFKVEKNKVNHLGGLFWSFKDGRTSVTQLNNSPSVKDNFAKRFPSSNWNQKEWVYTPLYVDAKEKSPIVPSKNTQKRDTTRRKIPIPKLQVLRESKRIKDEVRQIGNSYYIMREIPQQFTTLLQNSTNVWLKDSTDWLQKESLAIYTDGLSVEPEQEEISTTVLNQVFRHNSIRLDSLLKTEPALLYKCLMDKSGKIIEIMFDLAPESQLTLEEIRQIETVMRQSIRFTDIRLSGNNTLKNIRAKYILYSDHIEFKKIKSISL